ncbi:MAG: 16S rRNA (cytidine1402-2'-O)-methyltransferase [Sulfitobacter sp.]|jgi:16S rRNA (cytidine1402-2'-O)-methyltransferase
MSNDDLSAGLYLVATPIGNARDITLRALDVLRAADVLVAEDTRTLRRLLEIHGVPVGDRQVIAHHDHSGSAARAGIIALVVAGKSVAFCSDAGSPLIADPGFELVRALNAEDLAVTVVPGASSVVAALSLAGVPTDRFCFLGFAPKPGGARQKWLREAADIKATLVMFETSKRIRGLLDDLCEVLGEGRAAGMGRELTKRFEQMRRGTLAELRDGAEADAPRGEIVLVIDRPGAVVVNDDTIDAALVVALRDKSVRDAVDAVAAQLSAPRRKVYQRALALDGDA